MITTALGAQYVQAALAKWRETNLWASHIPYAQMPQRQKDEIELAARLMMKGGRSPVKKEDVDFVPEAESDDLAA